MKRGGILGAAALIAAALYAPASAQPASSIPNPLKAIQDAFQQKDCKTVLSQGRTLRDAGPRTPTGNDLMLLNNWIVLCAAQEDDKAPMYRDVLRATAADPSSIYVWRVRFNYQILNRDYDAALATLELEAQSHQGALNDMVFDYLMQIHVMLDRAEQKAFDFRLLRIMSTAYHPVQPFADLEEVRLLYARKLYDKGDKAAARDLINAVQGFSGLVAITADPDFIALQDPKVDLSLAAERQYVEDQITLSQHPESLQGVIKVAEDLRRLGRRQDALAKLEGARARIGIAGSFIDVNSQQIWWWNALAQAYIATGDYDRMVESYRSAIAIGEDGQPNVSQLLNLSLDQIRFGRYRDALATLAKTPQGPNRLSPYGALVYHLGHGCAAWRAGRQADAAADIDYAAAHEKDGAMNRASLLLCTGDMDGAAALFIRLLDDPEKRPSVLWMLGNFRPGPPNIPPGPQRERLPAIKARADIQKAIAKSGGVRSYPFTFDDI